MRMRIVTRFGLVCAVVLVHSFYAPERGYGVTYEWSGIYPFDNWSFPLNWTPSAPHSSGAFNDTFIFHEGTLATSTRNDFGTYPLGNIVLPATGGVFRIEGDPVQFIGTSPSIQDDSEFANIIENDLLMPQGLTITTSQASGIELQLEGHISGVGDLIKEGPGLVLIDDIEAGGDIFVNDGTVYFYDETPFVSGGGTLHIDSGGKVNLEGGPATELYSLSGSGDLSLHSTGSVAVGLNDETFTFSGGFLNGSLATTVEKWGTGDFWLDGDANGTLHEGRLVVYEGSVLLNRSAADMQGGFVIVGDGVGGAEADVLALRWHEQISVAADGGDLLVNSSGLFDVAGYSEEIRSLTIGADGVVDTGGGSLTIVESLQQLGGTLKLSGGEVRTHSLFESSGATYDYDGGGSLSIDGGTASFVSGLSFGGGTDLDRPTLNIENGATATGSGSTIAGLPGEYATLNVTGAAGAQPSSLSLFNSTVGFRGTAQLTVSDGAHADIELELVLGSSSGSDGTVLASGVDGGLRSTLDVTGPFARILVASQGVGDLTIENGALVHSAGHVSVAEAATGNGTITVGGSAGGFDATLQADEDFYIGGGPLGAGGSGVVDVNTEGQVDVAGLRVYPNGQLHLDGGGELTTSALAIIDGGSADISGIDGSGNPSTWNGAGTLTVATTSTGSLTLSGGGQVSSSSGIIGQTSVGDGTVTITGTDGLGNGSKWSIDSGSLSVGTFGGGTLDINAGGELSSPSASIGPNSTSDGNVTVTGAGSLWMNALDVNVGRGGAGDTDSLSILDQARVEVGGTLSVFQTGTVTLDGGTLEVGTIDTSSGGTFDLIDGVLTVDTLDGDLDNNGGIIAPGNSPGTTIVTGNYTQNSGVLEIELGGLTAGTQYDVLDVTGTATLGGTLDVLLINGFENAITAADQFTILDAATLSGAFSNVAPGGRLAIEEYGGEIQVDYGATSPFDPTQIVLSDFAFVPIVATWVAGADQWTMATNWDINAVPDNGPPIYDALVPTGTATVDAPISIRALTVTTGGTVDVDNDLTVTEDASFTGGSVDVAAGATLQLGGNVLFEPGSYTGAGEISPLGAVVTLAGGLTVIQVDTYSLDDAAHTIISHNSNMILNVGQIDDDNKIDGTITVERGGQLHISQASHTFWEASALSTIDFENPSPATSSNQISGQRAILQGTLNVNGGLVRMRANTTLRSDPNFVPGMGVDRATVNMNPQGILRFDNIAVIEDALITGGGTLRFLQESTGVADIESNVDIDVDAFETVQDGTVNVNGSNIRVGAVALDSGSLTLDAAASFEVSDVATSPGVGFFVGAPGGTGNVSIDNGATLATVDANVGDAASGTGTVQILDAASQWTVGGTLTIQDGGSVQITDGTLSSTNAIQIAGGALSGTGTVAAAINNTGGTVSPGLSPGVLAVTGSYTQGASGSLAVEIVGTMPGTDHDQINITGAATLAGNLDVALINAFSPTPGETFEIMTFASRTGEFATVSGDVGLLDPVTFLLPLYSSTNLLMFTAIPGDGNLSGAVEAGDYTLWADGFGIGNEFTEGDYSGNGTVGAEDYTIWANNFGLSVIAPEGSPSAVPEPSALVLAYLALLSTGIARCRRGRQPRFANDI